MARIAINLGTPPSGVDGDPVRTAFEKVNTMTTEIYDGLGKSVKKGDFGLGSSAQPWIANLNNFAETQFFSYGNGTTQNIVPGMDYGEGVFISGQNSSEGSMLMMNHDSDRAFIKRKRAGAYSAGNEIVTIVGGQADPALNSGGIMSTSTVNGWVIEKFLNGCAHMYGRPARSAVLPANAVTTVNFAIPSLFVDEAYTTPTVGILATANTDVTIMSCFMSGGTTNVAIQIKNGSSAQAVDIRARISGRWK